MDTAENKALIRRFYAEIDAGNIDAMDELVAEDNVVDTRLGRLRLGF